MKKLSLTLCCLLIGQFVYSESDPLKITITAPRAEKVVAAIPQTILVVDKEDIAASGAATISDVLRTQASLQLTDLYGDGSRSSLNLRGYDGASNVLILVDGRRINNADLQAPELSSISLANVERIEIIQGGAGVLYGDQAVGGVINIVTKSVNQAKDSITVNSGSFNANQVIASTENLIKEDGYYRISLDRKFTNNYRNNNSLDYQNFVGRVGIAKNDNDLYFEYQNSREDLELPGSLLETEVTADPTQSVVDFENDFADTTTELFRLVTNIKLSDRWRYYAELSQEEAISDNLVSFRGFAGTETTQERVQSEFTPRFEGNFSVSNYALTILSGVDVASVDYIDGRGSELAQKTDSIYVQSTLDNLSGLQFVLGVRDSDVSNDVNNGTSIETFKNDASGAEFGINVRFDNRKRMFVRYDQSYRYPKVDEFTYISAGEENLETQVSNTTEIGYEYALTGWRSSFTIYSSEIENEIAFDPTAADPFGGTTGANVNFDKTARLGYVFDGKFSTDVGTFGINVNVVAPTFESGVYQGNIISGIAGKTGTLSFATQYAQWFNLYLEYLYIGKQYLSGDNANALEEADQYSVINANISKNYKDWTFALRINNLTDEVYAESQNAFGSIFPSPERNYQFSASTEF